MTELELFLASTTLAALALWLVERGARRAWEHRAAGSNKLHAEACDGWKEATLQLNSARRDLERSRNSSRAAARRNELSRGIDPRRDALWGDCA